MGKTVGKSRISGSSHGHKYAKKQETVKKNLNRKEADKKTKTLAWQKLGRRQEKQKKRLQD